MVLEFFWHTKGIGVGIFHCFGHHGSAASTPWFPHLLGRLARISDRLFSIVISKPLFARQTGLPEKAIYAVGVATRPEGEIAAQGAVSFRLGGVVTPVAVP